MKLEINKLFLQSQKGIESVKEYELMPSWLKREGIIFFDILKLIKINKLKPEGHLIAMC